MHNAHLLARQVWDHPCDEYYRTLYEEEKSKKARLAREGKGGAADKRRKDTAAKQKAGSSLGPQPLSGLQPVSPPELIAHSAHISVGAACAHGPSWHEFS